MVLIAGDRALWEGARGVFGDPVAIRRLAGQMSTQADRTRRDAQRAGAAAGVAWQSLAADRYRQQLESAAVAVRIAGGLMRSAEHVADAVVSGVGGLLGSGGSGGQAWQRANELTRRAEALDRVAVGLPRVDPRWVDLARSHGWAG
jgi:hypothetical protein